MISPHSTDGGQDFELNLASIIDCLTVIIAFLLLSSSFVSYGTLDTAVAAPQGQNASTAAEGQPQALTLSVTLRDAEHVDLDVSGARSEKRQIARGALKSELESMKARYPGLNGIVLTAASRVEYRDVIRGMDDARQVFPAVALGLGAGGSR
jgi:biopolymer transport protein ExbD